MAHVVSSHFQDQDPPRGVYVCSPLSRDSGGQPFTTLFISLEGSDLPKILHSYEEQPFCPIAMKESPQEQFLPAMKELDAP